MSEKKYVVPRKMLDAAIAGYARCVGTGSLDRFGIEWAVESALKWLAETPIVPTEEDILNEAKGTRGADAAMYAQWISWWQRRMFLAPDPDAPISDLIYPSPAGIPVVLSNSSVSVSDDVNSRIREAFRRGQKVSSK